MPLLVKRSLFLKNNPFLFIFFLQIGAMLAYNLVLKLGQKSLFMNQTAVYFRDFTFKKNSFP